MGLPSGQWRAGEEHKQLTMGEEGATMKSVRPHCRGTIEGNHTRCDSAQFRHKWQGMEVMSPKAGGRRRDSQGRGG